MVQIREAIVSDVEQIKELLLNNVVRLDENVFSDAQKDALKKYFSEHRVLKLVGDIGVFVAEDDSEIVGVVAVQDNLVFSLYSKDAELFVDETIGSVLLDFAENYSKTNGFDKLELMALEPLKPFLEKHSYVVEDKLILEFDGVKFNEFKFIKTF